MHTQAARPHLPFANAIAAQPLVESELYSPTPRRVQYTRAFQRERLWAVNIAVGFLAFAYYGWAISRNDMGFPTEFTIFSFVFALTIGSVWLYRESEVRRSQNFLRDGYAVQATVDHCMPADTESNDIKVQYEYIAKDRKKARGHFSVSTDTAGRIGGFVVGTRFTLLLHPTERYEKIPYFLITEVEIPGAAAVRTVPPSP